MRLAFELFASNEYTEGLKARMATIRQERQRIAEEMEGSEDGTEMGRELLNLAMGLLAEPESLFGRLGKAERRVFGLAVFRKLLVQGYEVVGHELHEPFDVLVDVQGLQEGQEDGSEREGAGTAGWSELAPLRARQGDPGDRSWDGQTPVHLLRLALEDKGSNRGVMVGPAGFEPATSRL